MNECKVLWVQRQQGGKKYIYAYIDVLRSSSSIYLGFLGGKGKRENTCDNLHVKLETWMRLLSTAEWHPLLTAIQTWKEDWVTRLQERHLKRQTTHSHLLIFTVSEKRPWGKEFTTKFYILHIWNVKILTWEFDSVPDDNSIIHTTGCQPGIMRRPRYIHDICLQEVFI